MIQQFSSISGNYLDDVTNLMPLIIFSKITLSFNNFHNRYSYSSNNGNFVCISNTFTFFTFRFIDNYTYGSRLDIDLVSYFHRLLYTLTKI